MRAGRTPAGGPDLRLAGVALGTWLSALAALYTGAVVAVAAAVAAAGAAALGCWLLGSDGLPAVVHPWGRWRPRRGGGVPRSGGSPGAAVAVRALVRSWGWVGVAVLLGVVCGSAATAARVAVRDAPPLAGLAAAGASVRADIVVRDDPRLVGEGGGRPTFLVPADLVRVRPLQGAADVGAAGRPGRREGGADAGAAGEPAAGEGSAADRTTARAGPGGSALPDPAAPRTGVRLDARILVLASDDGWHGLLPGQRVVVVGRLMPSRGGDLRAAVLSVAAAPTLVGRPGWAQRVAGDLRAGLQRACAPLPDEPGGLLPGLVVGDTSRLPAAVIEDFRTTGLVHLVAVSGANVAIVVGLVLLVARWARVGPRATALICTVALVGFVILARPSPSVVRAGVMGAVGLLALASGRSRAAVPALGAAVIVLVVYDPELAGHAGFALSVLATAGLLLLAPRWRDALRARGVPAGLAEALAVPAAAQVACGPVVASLSGTVSIVAMPANLLVVPAIAPATILGVSAAAVSPVWPGAAEFLAWLGGWPARWLVTVARHGADVPAGNLPWPDGVSGGLLLATLTVAALLVGRWALPRRVTAVVAVAAVIGALPVRVLADGWPPTGWILVACAVGQGDAVVLAAGPGAAVVVDAGPEPAAVDRCLRRLGVRRVPVLVISHFHADHVGGLDGVFRGRRVDALITSGWAEPEGGRAQVARAVASARADWRQIAAGWTYAVGGLRLSALGPSRPMRGTRSDPNNNSLVLRATVGGIAVLLTGDAEQEEQGDLLEQVSGERLRAAVLKLPHHGSAFQDRGFLEAVDPSIVLVSVGADNRYGHPNAALLDGLASGGARVLRTDVDGDIAAVRVAGGLAVVARGPEPGDGHRR